MCNKATPEEACVEKYLSKICGATKKDLPENPDWMAEIRKICEEEQTVAAAWAFHELNTENKNWNEPISQAFEQTAVRLANSEYKEEPHVRFLRTYCQYVSLTLQAEKPDESIKRAVVKEIQTRCRTLARTFGWTEGLCLLAGDASRLSDTEEKTAIKYYEQAEASSDCMYKTGKMYEFIYGNRETAGRYYQKAYSLNEKNYKAAYQLARHLEEDGKWLAALMRYEEALRLAEEDETLTTCSAEFQYKSLKRILSLLDQNTQTSGQIKMCKEKENNILPAVQKEFHALFQKLYKEKSKEKETLYLSELEKQMRQV